jgi:putative nucleotidyltransferase with HDIG domain
MAPESPVGVLSAEHGPPERAAVRGRFFPKLNALSFFYAAEMLLAAILFALCVPRFEGDIEILVLLLALNAGSEFVPINIYGDSQITPGLALKAAIFVLFGVPGAAISAPVAPLVRFSRRNIDIGRFAHGTAMQTIVYVAGAAVYDALAQVRPETFAWDMLPAVFAASLACFALSAVFVGAENTLRTGHSIGDFWGKHAWVAPNYLILGVIGLALAAAYLALGVVGILVFLAPAGMMRFSMKLYVDKTKENVEKLEMQNDALRTANIEVRRVSEELRVSYDGTLEALVNALDARDQETKGHSIRVQSYMMDIAREMGVVEGTQDWVDMQRGSLLHDVGKIGVSDTILLKPAKLTDAEWESMRQHPEIGFNMLKQVKFLQGAAEIILCHHERWDGRGYPRGLNEEEIPLGARIFTVVDTFDSMTSDRPYRKALTTLDALNEIMRCSGSQFDPRVVEAFLDIYETWVIEREELHRITVVKTAA